MALLRQMFGPSAEKVFPYLLFLSSDFYHQCGLWRFAGAEVYRGGVTHATPVQKKCYTVMKVDYLLFSTQSTWCFYANGGKLMKKQRLKNSTVRIIEIYISMTSIWRPQDSWTLTLCSFNKEIKLTTRPDPNMILSRRIFTNNMQQILVNSHRKVPPPKKILAPPLAIHLWFINHQCGL